jgi:hypothetical protein
LAVDQPDTGERIQVEAPIPEAFSALAKALALN